MFNSYVKLPEGKSPAQNAVMGLWSIHVVRIPVTKNGTRPSVVSEHFGGQAARSCILIATRQ